MLLLRRARALQSSVPPWVLHGELWFSPRPFVIQFWSVRAQLYEQCEIAARNALDQPAGNMAHLIMDGKSFGPRVGRPN